MPKVAVPGGEIDYRLVGEGRALLLIRGYGSHKGWWDPRFLEPLSRHLQLILYDHRGTGGSSHYGGEYTIELLAGDAASLLLGLGLEKVGVFGLSMGGMVAQELALGWPSLVGRLVLGATHCGGERALPPSPRTARALKARAAGEGVEEEWLRAVFTADFVIREKEAVGSYLQRAAQDPVPAETVSLQAEAVAGFDSWGRLPRLSVPTLILHGEEDGIVPVENGRLLSERIPGSRLLTFPGVGHDFTAQVPREAAAAIISFLLDPLSVA